MIKPNELRIGNLILWDPKQSHPTTTLPPVPVEVTSIWEDKIGYVSPNVEHRVEPFEDDVVQTQTLHKPFEEFEPIALTPAILEKSGFMHHQNLLSSDYWLLDGKMKIVPGDDQLWFTEGNHKLCLASVHQLQNLYFAWTGEELEVSI